MKALIIADSSPVIALLNIQRIDLLPLLFEQIIVPEKVAQEVSAKETPESAWYSQLKTGFISVQAIEPDPRLPLLLAQVDLGESEAILLAKQLELPLLIDERAGRKMAELFGVKITGLVGILMALRHRGHVTPEEMPLILEDLGRVNFRLSAGLKKRLLTPS